MTREWWRLLTVTAVGFFFLFFFFVPFSFTIRGIRGIHSEGGDGYVLYSVQRTTYEIPPTH